MTPHAIETKYRGFVFRSRLEAKIAVFFDLCGWNWSYEPREFNGWIPDFALGWMPTLCEVKPFYAESEWVDAINKIMASGCEQDVILFGADPVWTWQNSRDLCEDAPRVATLLSMVDGQWQTWPLNFGWTEGNRKLGLCPLQGHWNNLIWQAPANVRANRWSRVWLNEGDVESVLVARWAEACNQSRWVPLGA